MRNSFILVWKSPLTKALLGAGAIRRFKMWQKTPVMCVAAPLFHLTYEQKPLEGATRGGCGKNKEKIQVLDVDVIF